VGGQASGLVAAERELGLDSRSVALEPSPYGYPVDDVLRRPSEGRARFELRRLQLLARALRDYDVVHFNFGSAILPLPARGPGASGAHRLYARVAAGLDLRLLRRLGKGIVVSFQGDDVRQGDVLSRTYPASLADEVEPGYYTAEGDTAKRRIVELFDRTAHAIFYLNPDLANVLPARARFLPYAHVDPRSWTPGTADPGEPPLVVHAPSRRDTKGTRHVLAAVEALRREGVPFRFELVEGVTQSDARAVYERSDILVDQLVAGWYGGLAVEAMALGVPVVAFVREDDLGVVPAEMRVELPTIQATPETVLDVLRGLLTGPRSALVERGRRSRAYVERWHDPLRIAAELRGIYEEAASSVAR
jgi:glycosyltransferase involved in cell wall biosynthesis